MRLFDLTGRVVLVTGASRGLGWAMTQALAEAGAHVALSARDPAVVEERVGALTERGLSASAAPFDVTDEAAMKAAVAKVAEEQGRLDTVIANAGVNKRAPLMEVDAQTARWLADTNIVSVLLLAREAARAMVPRQAGRIILLASVAGQGGRAGIHAYAATKAAVIGMTKTLAAELGPDGINVNAIAPGFFKTDMNQAVMENPELERHMAERTALKRWGEPEELAGTAIYLASDAASYVTGQVITVDGGTMALL